MGDRTKKTFLNITSNIIVNIIKTIFSFITRTVFIYCLGKEALGLNGLFTNVISMLSLAELGVGTAINFSLYEPIAKNDEKKIGILMSFYKKIYRIIGTTVGILGIALIPFLKYLINGIEQINNVLIIYSLYLINTVSTYFISYKETLINADQKKYKLATIESISLIVLNIFQVIFLLISKNFIVYLLIQIIIQFIQRVVTNIYITKKYKNINFCSNEKMEKKDLKLIRKNVKAMFLHKIGDYCINGTDNLIISAYLNITTVGIYSNYLTIINLLNTFIYMIYSNLTASVGNFIVTENEQRKNEILKKINFIGFVIFGFCSIILINVFNDFVVIWVGKDYCFDFIIVLFIVINFYITGMRIPINTVKTAAGLYDVDKFTPLLQSVINLAVSIVLVKKIGLLGVIVGTTISSIAIPIWQRPYLVYKHVLKKSSKEYFASYLKYILILIITSGVTLWINGFIALKNDFIVLMIKGIVSSITFISVVYLVYKNSDEMVYIINVMNNFLYRRKKNETRAN